MSEIINDSRLPSCITCFLNLESINFKDLVLISSCLAREELSGFARVGAGSPSR
jgi:hypothetical protein